MSVESKAERQPSQEPFPVSREAALRTLQFFGKRFSRRFDRKVIRQRDILFDHQPEIQKDLDNSIYHLTDEQAGEITFGAVLAHRAIYEQFKILGQNVPVCSPEAIQQARSEYKSSNMDKELLDIAQREFESSRQDIIDEQDHLQVVIQRVILKKIVEKDADWFKRLDESREHEVIAFIKEEPYFGQALTRLIHDHPFEQGFRIYIGADLVFRAIKKELQLSQQP